MARVLGQMRASTDPLSGAEGLKWRAHFGLIAAGELERSRPRTCPCLVRRPYGRERMVALASRNHLVRVRPALVRAYLVAPHAPGPVTGKNCKTAPVQKSQTQNLTGDKSVLLRERQDFSARILPRLGSRCCCGRNNPYNTSQIWGKALICRRLIGADLPAKWRRRRVLCGVCAKRRGSGYRQHPNPS